MWSSTCSGRKSAPSTTWSACGRSATKPRQRPPLLAPNCAVLLHIVARGKIGRTPEAELTERYLKRIQWPTKLTELPDRGGTSPDPAANGVTVVLDERGEPLSCIELGGER